MVDGKITKRGKVKMSSTGKEHQVEEVGVFTPKKRTVEEAVDVIYHLLVLLKSKKITLKEINNELAKRK